MNKYSRRPRLLRRGRLMKTILYYPYMYPYSSRIFIRKKPPSSHLVCRAKDTPHHKHHGTHRAGSHHHAQEPGEGRTRESAIQDGNGNALTRD